MKKILLSLFIIFSFTLSKSQVVSKGDKLFGGNMSFFIVNYNNSQVTTPYGHGNVAFRPSYAWAVSDNLVMGIKGSFSYYREKTEMPAGEERITRIFNTGAGIFLKKYRSLKDRFGIYFDNTISASKNSQRTFSNQSPGTKYDSWAFGYDFSPGVFYKFSNDFFGEANLGGLTVSYFSPNNSTNVKSLWINGSFLQYINLGINYRISQNKKDK